MDMMDHRARSFGSPGGRIILLGDGTELTSSEADTEMFDHDDEDLDLDQQVHKGGASSESDDEPDSNSHADDEIRRQREGTPAPTGAPPPAEKGSTPNVIESPLPMSTEKSDGEEDVKEKEDKTAAPPSSQTAESNSVAPTEDDSKK